MSESINGSKGESLFRIMATTIAAGGLAVGAYLLGANNSEETVKPFVSCGQDDVAIIADPKTGRGEVVCVDWLGDVMERKPDVFTNANGINAHK